VQVPSELVTFVILPLLLVDMLEDAAPLPLVTLELAPLPLVTDTPGPPFPTVVWPDTWPLPALIEVDIPLGGDSPGFKCTTLHPFVLVSALLPLVLLLLLAAPAAPASANTAAPIRAAVVTFMCRSSKILNCSSRERRMARTTRRR
jgi:hypothetical protein